MTLVPDDPNMAQAWFSGEPPDQTVGFYIPRGNRGEIGPRGPMGVKGDKGDKGDKGEQGLGSYARGALPSGADLNTYGGVANAGLWTVTSSTLAATIVNAPAGLTTTAYLVDVIVGSNGVTIQQVIPYSSFFNIYTRAANNLAASSWSSWKKTAFDDGTSLNVKTALTSNTDLNTITVSGAYPVISSTVAPTLVNAPSTLPGFYEVLTSTNGITNQRFTEYSTNRIFNRITFSINAGTWTAWKEIGANVTNNTSTGTTTVSDAGLSNSVLVQDWSRRMGGRKKVTTATVAFRFDHGLANFNTKIRPELESRNFKYSLALCSGQWDRTENVGVTAAMVNTWVTGGLAEIWNHSKDHGSGDNTEAGWKAAILDGLTELRIQIPNAKIDGFAPPGSAGTDFGGFVNGNTLEQFYDTDGGRYILSKHAVAAGYIGATQRWQDGMVRQGLGHITLDSYTLAQVQTAIQSAETDKRALQFMLHPSLLDNGTNITTATFVSMLNYIQTEVTAGRLKVVSPYEQLLTDVL